LEAEIGNFRAALMWAQTEAVPPEAHVQLTAALWPYWQYHGLDEGRGHLRTAHLRSEGMGTGARAQILLGEARLAFTLFELEEALALGQESLALFRRLDDRRALAEALLYTGIVAREKGDPAQAISLLTEGLEEARQCGWTRGCAMICMNLGLSAMETDSEQARTLMEEGLSLAEEVGDLLITAHSLQELGHLEMLKGDPGRAGSLLERALSIHRRLSDRDATALTLRWLGALSRRQGDLAQAVSYMQEAVAISREQGHLMNLVMSLSECGGVLYEQRAYGQAKAAFTEALSLFRQRGGEHGIGFGCNLLGSTLFHLGEYVRARELHQETLAFYQSRQQTEGIVWSLERLAVVEAAHGDAQKAARLLGAASLAREGLGIPMGRWDQEDGDHAVVSVCATLGEAEFERLWAEGRTFTLEQAAAYALTPA
jgi:tetratricopeptide (TPR) repeat protein